MLKFLALKGAGSLHVLNGIFFASCGRFRGGEKGGRKPEQSPSIGYNYKEGSRFMNYNILLYQLEYLNISKTHNSVNTIKQIEPKYSYCTVKHARYLKSGTKPHPIGITMHTQEKGLCNNFAQPYRSFMARCWCIEYVSMESVNLLNFPSHIHFSYQIRIPEIIQNKS